MVLIKYKSYTVPSVPKLKRDMLYYTMRAPQTIKSKKPFDAAALARAFYSDHLKGAGCVYFK
jgi:hypothetical protein